MSLLMFDQTETDVLIVADTLVTTDGEVSMFQQKVWPLPHLNAVIALTGTANVGAEWYHWITNTPGITDIETLNATAPQVLGEIYDAMTKAYGDIGSTVIFAFGFPDGSDKIVRYGYRSESRFNPERSAEPGFLAKPYPEGVKLTRPNERAEWVSLALWMREQNYLYGTDGGVAIGGELYATQLANRQVQTVRWHRFDDYEKHLEEMTK